MRQETLYLVVEVVAVAGDEDVDVPHDLQHVQPLLQCGAGEVWLQHLQPVLLAGQVAHVPVTLPVVEGNGRQVVEGSVQIVSDLC